INALRADRNECVRYEAALSLGRGCCCTKNVLAALSITVSGSDRDGNPSENSERVRAAAQFALDHCLARLCVSVAAEGPAGAEESPPEPPPPEKPPEGLPPPAKDGTLGKAEALLPPFYQKLQARPMKELIEQARNVLDQSHVTPTTQVGPSNRP